MVVIVVMVVQMTTSITNMASLYFDSNSNQTIKRNESKPRQSNNNFLVS